MNHESPQGNVADQIWEVLVELVMESRNDWRRQVAEVTGMPFSRWRALKRLVDTELTLSELGERMSTDAPATTVAVNDLESRGLVRRYPHPQNARAKLVAITSAGRDVIRATDAIPDPAPPALAALPETELAQLQRIFAKIAEE